MNVYRYKWEAKSGKIIAKQILYCCCSLVCPPLWKYSTKHLLKRHLIEFVFWGKREEKREWLTEVGKHTFFKVRKSQIREFLGSFRYRKSANFPWYSQVPGGNWFMKKIWSRKSRVRLPLTVIAVFAVLSSLLSLKIPSLPSSSF
jgi:hypothetical protein